MNHFKNLMQECGLNAIFALSETWLNNNNDSLLWNVLTETHVMFRSDRNSDNKMGAVLPICSKNTGTERYY